MNNPAQPVAIITGASSGIGEAAARVLGRAGYRVVLAARRLDRLEVLQGEIEAAGGKALPVETDVSNLESLKNLIKRTLEAYGRIDVLFNNAGFGRFKWLEELDPAKDIAGQIEVNLTGVIQLTSLVLPTMIQQKSGHIINMASMAGYVATPTYTVYAATKHGLRGFTDALRREVGIWGVRVSALYPGGVSTEFGSHTGAERKTGITTPKALLLTPEDVGNWVLRLAQNNRSRNVPLPWVSWLGIWLNRFFPGLNDWIIERTFTKPERGL
ncbi:MAG: SDR family oxidoreductase [Anaerolineae bacterium]|nr:MAG: SDR family oxidoreductase [Anaerolineae bacterium]